MARPIKETPILFGEDARRFEARMQEKRHISAEERAQMDEAYRIGMEMMRLGEELNQQRAAQRQSKRQETAND